MAGYTKAISYEKAKASMPWVNDSTKGLVIFIGVAELLGGFGLILPYAFGIAPILTPIAAIGLAVVMILAAGFHVMRKEYQGISINIILLALALFVAIGQIREVKNIYVENFEKMKMIRVKSQEETRSSYQAKHKLVQCPGANSAPVASPPKNPKPKPKPGLPKPNPGPPNPNPGRIR
uniref:DoxX family protein n=1 Tax=Batrachochytrium dendrobatidis (strain JAM81 / FGSC 10211) TaxID=684364 RepID=F4PEW0_BATDJ|eukprot:XP_006683146.1 hypothetical protein BATDEDRAFT_28705 [Batrachochytrium dendrobatidis JAM81]